MEATKAHPLLPEAVDTVGVTAPIPWLKIHRNRTQGVVGCRNSMPIPNVSRHF